MSLDLDLVVVGPYSYNVGVDVNNYMPVALDDLITRRGNE